MVARMNFLFVLSPTAMAVVAAVGRGHGHLRRDHRPDPERHQEGAGLLHGQPAGLHVAGLRRGRLRRRHLPRHDPRLLQGPALPRLRLGDPRHEQRAGHAGHGRAEEQAAGHLLDLPGRHPGHCRVSSRWPVSSARTRSSGRPSAASRAGSALGHRLPGRRADRLLHDAPGGADLLRREPGQRRGARATSTNRRRP